MWEHKPGKHNQVVDVLSCKQVQEYVTTLTRFEPDFVERIKEERKKRGQSSRHEVSSFSFASLNHGLLDYTYLILHKN